MYTDMTVLLFGYYYGPYLDALVVGFNWIGMLKWILILLNSKIYLILM